MKIKQKKSPLESSGLFEGIKLLSSKPYLFSVFVQTLLQFTHKQSGIFFRWI
jgi:hypothetical protein